jgi:hypothetical protein
MNTKMTKLETSLKEKQDEVDKLRKEIQDYLIQKEMDDSESCCKDNDVASLPVIPRSNSAWRDLDLLNSC